MQIRKYEATEKARLVREYPSGEIGICALGRAYGITHGTNADWIVLFALNVIRT